MQGEYGWPGILVDLHVCVLRVSANISAFVRTRVSLQAYVHIW